MNPFQLSQRSDTAGGRTVSVSREQYQECYSEIAKSQSLRAIEDPAQRLAALRRVNNLKTLSFEKGDKRDGKLFVANSSPAGISFGITEAYAGGDGVPQITEVKYKLSVQETSRLRDWLNSGIESKVQPTITENQLHDLTFKLVAECERAMKQRDEYQSTGKSTAAHGGSHDTAFGFILREQLTQMGIKIA